MPTTLSKIWLSVRPIFAVLFITPSFLVRFRPVKYEIEALDVVYPMVRGQSAQSSFCSGQRVGQTSVKLGQTLGNVFRAPSRGSFDVVGPCHIKSAWSNLVNPDQTWSNLLKLREMCSGPCLEALLMWWTPVGSDRLGSGCLVSCADTQENPGGKNRIMTSRYWSCQSTVTFFMGIVARWISSLVYYTFLICYHLCKPR